MTSLKGQYVISKTATGNYNFRIKASNLETIAVSGGAGYSTASGCKAGLESIKKISDSKIEDQTLKNFEVLPNPKFEIYQDKAMKFRFRLRARNGELVCVSEGGYASKSSCKAGILSLAKWVSSAEVVVDY